MLLKHKLTHEVREIVRSIYTTVEKINTNMKYEKRENLSCNSEDYLIYNKRETPKNPEFINKARLKD